MNREADDGALARAFAALPCYHEGNRASVRVDRQAVHRAQLILKESGIVSAYESWTQDLEVGSGGRPSIMTVEQVLVLLIVLVLEGSAPLVSRMAQILESRLTRKARMQLGLQEEDGDYKAWYDRAWRRIHKFLDVVDPYPYPKRCRLTWLEWKKWEAHWKSPDQQEKVRQKKARLAWVTNQLLEATFKTMPLEIRTQWEGNTCIDATPVPACKNGTSVQGRGHHVSSQPHAGWYARSHDRRDDDRPRNSESSDGQLAVGKQNKVNTKTDSNAKKCQWAYEAHLIVTTANTSRVDVDFPVIVIGMSFDKPSAATGPNAISAYSSVAGRGHPTGFAISDRGYSFNLKAENYQLPMVRIGYKLIGDYMDSQLGRSGGYEGAVMVEGKFYCPAMRHALVNATVEYKKDPTDMDAYLKLLEARQAFELRAKESADTRGSQRMMCPAAGESPTVTCALREKLHGTGAAKSKGLPRLRPPEDMFHGKICTNKESVTFPIEAGAKLRQHGPAYGTQHWKAIYSPARNAVEHFNGYVKDENREALANSGRRRMRGLAVQWLLTALLVLSANLRRIQSFLGARQRDKQRKCQQLNKRRFKRTHAGLLEDDEQTRNGSPPSA